MLPESRLESACGRLKAARLMSFVSQARMSARGPKARPTCSCRAFWCVGAFHHCRAVATPSISTGVTVGRNDPLMIALRRRCVFRPSLPPQGAPADELSSPEEARFARFEVEFFFECERAGGPPEQFRVAVRMRYLPSRQGPSSDFAAACKGTEPHLLAMHREGARSDLRTVLRPGHLLLALRDWAPPPQTFTPTRFPPSFSRPHPPTAARKLVLALEDNAGAQNMGVFPAPIFGSRQCDSVDGVNLQKAANDDYVTAQRRVLLPSPSQAPGLARCRHAC